MLPSLLTEVYPLGISAELHRHNDTIRHCRNCGEPHTRPKPGLIQIWAVPTCCSCCFSFLLQIGFQLSYIVITIRFGIVGTVESLTLVRNLASSRSGPFPLAVLAVSPFCFRSDFS